LRRIGELASTVIKNHEKDLSLHVKDKILVADVGGGTVDIVWCKS
jgi:molecular chaperone DnaK (HSP70)